MLMVSYINYIKFNLRIFLYYAALLEFILDDFRANFDLAIAWLFAEYTVTESYYQSRPKTWSYDKCLTQLLHGACEKLESRDR